MTDALQNEIDRYVKQNPGSAALHERAAKVMPGGDSRNSIWWAPFPVYLTSGRGTKIYDVDGNERVDMVNNMTTLIVGHRHPKVVAALREQLDNGGVSFPAPSPSVIKWAEILVERVPSVDKIRFVNSGTEGTMNAIRAARAFTGRQKIAKCEGAYHGTHDIVSFSVTPPLDQAGDALNPDPVAGFEGIPAAITEDVVVMPYNDIHACERIIRRHAQELAAVIVEPVNGQCGMVPARPEFLKGLRALTRELGIVLIFDEVIAFRVARGGSQEHYGVTPDMTCFGKVIGGGMPVGAFGGRDDIMSLYDPSSGPPRVQHAGTFNGNPMTAAAGVATLELLTPEAYRELEQKGDYLRARLRKLFSEMEAPMGVTGVASLFALQFTSAPVTDYRSFAKNDKKMQRTMFLGLINEGYLMSNRCAGNVSTVHERGEIDGFVDAVGRVLERAGKAGS
jgi:glutamate-1-semialdehyde 2,1-aminomutase